MGELTIGKLLLGPVSTNCYYMYRAGGCECIVIDPAYNGEGIFNNLKDKGLKIKTILLTHGHFDHIGGCNELRELSGAEVYALDREQQLLEDARLNVSEMTGHPIMVKADKFLQDEQELKLLDTTIHVLATPGHTYGSCCYYIPENDCLFSGDTLFCESVGRTDLPTGSGRELKESIRNKLSVLPDETVVYPGHDVETTIGHEKEYNSFWI